MHKCKISSRVWSPAVVLWLKFNWNFAQFTLTLFALCSSAANLPNTKRETTFPFSIVLSRPEWVKTNKQIFYFNQWIVYSQMHINWHFIFERLAIATWQFSTTRWHPFRSSTCYCWIFRRLFWQPHETCGCTFSFDTRLCVVECWCSELTPWNGIDKNYAGILSKLWLDFASHASIWKSEMLQLSNRLATRRWVLDREDPPICLMTSFMRFDWFVFCFQCSAKWKPNSRFHLTRTWNVRQQQPK